MTSPAVTVTPDDTVDYAARLMYSRKVKRLPVVDASGRPVGIVSRTDILAVFDRTAEEIRTEIMTHVIPGHSEPSWYSVLVKDGVVTLEGTPETVAIGHDIVRRARHVQGVVAVSEPLALPIRGRFPLDSVDRSSCADAPWRAQTMNATESASAFRFPWQPDVVVPGESAMVLRKRTCPNWCASAQIAWPLVRPGRMRMRRAAQARLRPRGGRPRARLRSPLFWPASTGSPTGQAVLAEIARPGWETAARLSRTGPRRTRRGARHASCGPADRLRGPGGLLAGADWKRSLDAFFIPVDLSPCRAPRRISLDQGRTWYPG